MENKEKALFHMDDPNDVCAQFYHLSPDQYWLVQKPMRREICP